MKPWLRVAGFLVAAVAGAVGLVCAGQAAAPTTGVLIPIEGTVDEGMAHLVSRAVDEANLTGAPVILEINTPGGLVSAAFEIRDALLRAKGPTVAYISHRAYSAGALIALSAKRIEMAPGSSIGAAEPIPKTVKTVAALRAEFASTAARNHRNTTLAAAMVDARVDAPSYKKAGAILALTADEAKRAKIADAIAPTLEIALKDAGLSTVVPHVAAYTFGERVARFATSPEMSGILLSIGVLGLIIEMQTLHGIAGLIGVLALGLFFGTHIYAGFSDPLVVVLAVIGVIAILFELHVLPGHGIAGIVGVVALLASVVLAFGIAFFATAIQALAIMIVLTVFGMWLVVRYFPENAWFKRITLSAFQGPEYVASTDFRGLLGYEGIATTFLRPAGVASINGRRVDVLTEGDFIPAGAPVRVSRVEGARVFVRPVKGE